MKVFVEEDVLFPEGTSSDGQTVLPFKSSLLEPATKTSRPLSAGLLQYEIDDGDVGEEVCYWKDMTFLAHLLNLLAKDHIMARVRLLPVERTTECRKAMAQQLHSVVSRLMQWKVDFALPGGPVRLGHAGLHMLHSPALPAL